MNNTQQQFIEIEPTTNNNIMHQQKTNWKFITKKQWSEFSITYSTSINLILNIQQINEAESIERLSLITNHQLQEIQKLLSKFQTSIKVRTDRWYQSDTSIVDIQLKTLKRWSKRRDKYKKLLLIDESINLFKNCLKFLKSLLNCQWMQKSADMDFDKLRTLKCADILDICRSLIISNTIRLKKVVLKAQKEKENSQIKLNFQLAPQQVIRDIFANVKQLDCPIEMSRLEKFWEKEAESKGRINTKIFPANLYKDKNISQNDWIKADSEITLEEVKKTLKKLKSKKANGPDGIVNEFWKLEIDQIALWLCATLQRCLEFQNIPKQWKCGNQILLYKGGDPNDEREWRPITLLNTIYKIFAMIISNRVHSNFAKALDKAQKGFQKINGCQENLMSLMRTIDDFTLHQANIENSSLKLFLFFIDFRNAFGSVEHELIFWVFQQLGIPSNSKIIQTIKNIYTDSFFLIKSANGSSKSIARTKGVFQGCPLSPTLFLFAIDPILRWLNNTPGEYSFINYQKSMLKTSIKCLGYADDLLYFRSNPSSIETMCKKLQEIKDNLYIAINAAKSAIIAPNTTLQEYSKFDFFIDKEKSLKNRIPLVKEYKYHGVLLNSLLFNNQSRIKGFELIENSELKKIKDKLQKIKTSGISLTQKLQVIKWITYGRVKYLCPAIAFSKSFLDNCDTLVRKAARFIFNLPPSTTNDFFHMPIKDAGLGLPILHTAITLQRIKFWAIIFSKNDLCKNITLASMFSESYYSNLIINKTLLSSSTDYFVGATSNPISDFKFFLFNTQIIQNKITFRKYNRASAKLLTRSYWRDCANQCFEIKVNTTFHNFTTIYNIENVTPGYIIDSRYIHKFERSCFNSPIQYRQLENVIQKLKAHFNDNIYYSFTQHLNKIGYQTYLFSDLHSEKSIRRFQLSGIAKLLQTYSYYLPDKMIQFTMKARLNLIGNAVYKEIYNIRANSNCPRYGCNEREWTKHITSSCPKALNLYKIRHDEVLEILSTHIEKYYEDLIFDTATIQNNRQRPDIAFSRNKSNGKIQIGEITIPFDNLINQKREFKEQKYRRWIQELTLDFPETNHKLSCIVIGALGTIDAKIIKNLQLFGLSKSESKKLALKLSHSVIKNTYKVWTSRCKLNWSRRAPPRIRNNTL